MRSKNSVRVSGVAALCCIAVNSWAGQAQQDTADDDPQKALAEASAIASYDSSADSIEHDRLEAAALIPFKEAGRHPVYPTQIYSVHEFYETLISNYRHF